MIDIYDNDNIYNVLEKIKEEGELEIILKHRTVFGKIDFMSKNLIVIKEPTNKFDLKTNEPIFNILYFDIYELIGVGIRKIG